MDGISMEKPHLEDLHGLPINDPWKMISTNCAEWPNLFILSMRLHRNMTRAHYTLAIWRHDFENMFDFWRGHFCHCSILKNLLPGHWWFQQNWLSACKANELAIKTRHDNFLHIDMTYLIACRISVSFMGKNDASNLSYTWPMTPIFCETGKHHISPISLYFPCKNCKWCKQNGLVLACFGNGAIPPSKRVAVASRCSRKCSKSITNSMGETWVPGWNGRSLSRKGLDFKQVWISSPDEYGPYGYRFDLGILGWFNLHDW